MASRPKPKPWVTNALTGKKVSPNIDWLITRLLAALNPPEDHPGDYNAHVIDRRAHVVDYHAHQIYGHWVTWRRRGDTTAIEIRGTQRPRAVRVPAKGSIESELQRLLRTAQGRSDRRWQTAWLGVSSETHRLIDWPPVIRREVNSDGKLVRFERDAAVNHRRISVHGLEAIMPTRADAVPLIEAALRKHEAMSAADRQRRRRDVLADDVVRAVAVAYFDLTGERGFVWDDLRGQYRGGLLDLGRDIEARFGGTGLFTARRLRFISETLVLKRNRCGPGLSMPSPQNPDDKRP